MKTKRKNRERSATHQRKVKEEKGEEEKRVKRERDGEKKGKGRRDNDRSNMEKVCCTAVLLI